MSSPRTRGPIRRVVSFEAVRAFLLPQRAPGIMGPRVRGDDEMRLLVPATRCARVLEKISAPKTKEGACDPQERAQGRPGARCTRGFVCKLCKKTHTSMQVERKQSGLPCAMVLRLIPRSPRRRIRLVTVARGLCVQRNPVGPRAHPRT